MNKNLKKKDNQTQDVNPPYLNLILWLSIVSIILTGFIYQYLPDQIPVHWNIYGEIDNYAGRPWIFLMAAIPAILYLLIKVIPRIDPRRDSYIKHRIPYTIVTSGIALVMLLLHWVVILFTLEFPVDVVMVIKLLLGILWIVVGNYMPLFRHNYTVGIRTPWTLADERVWSKVHRVGGYLFVLVGVLWVGFAMVQASWSFVLLVGSLFLMVFGLFVYSWWLFRRLN